jgi:hypothetical protein
MSRTSGWAGAAGREEMDVERREDADSGEDECKIVLNKLPQASLIIALINLVLPSFTLFRTAGRNCGEELRR